MTNKQLTEKGKSIYKFPAPTKGNTHIYTTGGKYFTVHCTNSGAPYKPDSQAEPVDVTKEGYVQDICEMHVNGEL